MTAEPVPGASLAIAVAHCAGAAAAPAHAGCVRCGQLTASTATTVCASCRDLERGPQGEPLQLFAPAAAALTGQLTLKATFGREDNHTASVHP